MIAVCTLQRRTLSAEDTIGKMSSRFSCNSEAKASELQEKLEKMFIDSGSS